MPPLAIYLEEKIPLDFILGLGLYVFVKNKGINQNMQGKQLRKLEAELYLRLYNKPQPKELIFITSASMI